MIYEKEASQMSLLACINTDSFLKSSSVNMLLNKKKNILKYSEFKVRKMANLLKTIIENDKGGTPPLRKEAG